MKIKSTLTLPDGRAIEVLNYVPACENCGMPSESELCSPCDWLAKQYAPRMWGENQGLFNRRWQFYFNRGWLTESHPTTPLWETKRKLQDW